MRDLEILTINELTLDTSPRCSGPRTNQSPLMAGLFGAIMDIAIQPSVVSVCPVERQTHE